MNKEITIYELAGLIKDGKAPNKIKYDDLVYEYKDIPEGSGYVNESGDYKRWLSPLIIFDDKENLNSKVEIIKEKPELIEHIYTGDRYLFASKDNGMTKEDRKQLDSYFRVLLLSHDVLVNAVNYLLEKEK